MSRKNRSIKQRLERAQSQAQRLEIAHDWAARWYKEQNAIIGCLVHAQEIRNWDAVKIYTLQMETVIKKMYTIHSVLNTIARASDDPQQKDSSDSK
jgi:hypothetical protein